MNDFFFRCTETFGRAILGAWLGSLVGLAVGFFFGFVLFGQLGLVLGPMFGLISGFVIGFHIGPILFALISGGRKFLFPTILVLLIGDGVVGALNARSKWNNESREKIVEMATRARLSDMQKFLSTPSNQQLAAKNLDQLLQCASINPERDVLHELLKLDPRGKSGLTLCAASKFGAFEVIDQLLNDGYVEPSFQSNGEPCFPVFIAFIGLDQAPPCKNFSDDFYRAENFKPAVACPKVARKVKRLIAGGAKLYNQEGLSALSAATDTMCLKELLPVLMAADQKIDEHDKDEMSWTPLMHSIISQHPENITLLLAAGANPHETDGKGRTAIQIARDYFSTPNSMLSSRAEKAIEIFRLHGI